MCPQDDDMVHTADECISYHLDIEELEALPGSVLRRVVVDDRLEVGVGDLLLLVCEVLEADEGLVELVV